MKRRWPSRESVKSDAGLTYCAHSMSRMNGNARKKNACGSSWRKSCSNRKDVLKSQIRRSRSKHISRGSLRSCDIERLSIEMRTVARNRKSSSSKLSEFYMSRRWRCSVGRQKWIGGMSNGGKSRREYRRSGRGLHSLNNRKHKQR